MSKWFLIFENNKINGQSVANVRTKIETSGE